MNKRLSLAESAQLISGWIRLIDQYPAIGSEIEVLHFGGTDSEIIDTATVNQWGVCPPQKTADTESHQQSLIGGNYEPPRK